MPTPSFMVALLERIEEADKEVLFLVGNEHRGEGEGEHYVIAGVRYLGRHRETDSNMPDARK